MFKIYSSGILWAEAKTLDRLKSKLGIPKHIDLDRFAEKHGLLLVKLSA